MESFRDISEEVERESLGADVRRCLETGDLPFAAAQAPLSERKRENHR
jgi:hypothetical protein